MAGKFGAVQWRHGFTGMPWFDSLALGALMNTRGLMELIVLNIGYDLGILSPTMYTMMVIMALTTTCMAGPALGTGRTAARPVVRGLQRTLGVRTTFRRRTCQRIGRLRAVDLIPWVRGLQAFVDVIDVLHAFVFEPLSERRSARFP